MTSISPTDLDRENAAFVDVEVERMDLWIKGVTPERSASAQRFW